MRFPIWPCFRWGLPCRPCYHVRGELLPRSGSRPTTPVFTGAPDPSPTAPAFAEAPFHPCLIRSSRSPCSTQGTLSPCGDKPFRPSAVYSLLHFPSPHGARSLTGILLCEARTFLSAEACALCPAVAWPTSRCHYTLSRQADQLVAGAGDGAGSGGGSIRGAAVNTSVSLRISKLPISGPMPPSGTLSSRAKPSQVRVSVTNSLPSCFRIQASLPGE